MNPPQAQSVISKDGTTISYTVTGAGPALVVVPGNNRMAHNYEKLAADLASDFTVVVIERRGRGASGPQGGHYSLEREVEDLQAVLAATGATAVFGHSYGGLVALHAACAGSSIKQLIAFEPVVSINGSFDLSWLPEYEAAYHAGKLVKATVIFLQKSRLSMVSSWPKPFLYLLASLLLAGKSGREMRALMPCAPAEIRETARADSDGNRYRSITAATLLLGGSEGAQPVLRILPQLKDIIPRAELTILPKLNHNAPDLGPVSPVSTAIRSHLIRS